MKHFFRMVAMEEPMMNNFVCMRCTYRLVIYKPTTRLFISDPMQLSKNGLRHLMEIFDGIPPCAGFKPRATPVGYVRDGGDNQGHRQALSSFRTNPLSDPDFVWRAANPELLPKTKTRRWYWPWKRCVRK